MAKKPKTISISKTDLAKLSRSEQRRYLDLGYVQGETPPAEVAKAKAK